MLERWPEPPQTVNELASVELKLARRVRQSPWTRFAAAAGASGWSVYNHMLLPVAFRSLEEDYRHLKSAVQVWDVAAERQVEITGPDATRLVQLMTPRRVADAAPMRCLYTPVCDADGGMLNDPLMLRLEEERWWVSIADTDVILFAKGIAAALRLDVEISEPDVYPLAVQGPRADELMARVFGEGIRELKFFRAERFEALGAEHIVARCGWSGQGGFEIFVGDRANCEPLWHALFEAGGDLDVRAGCPNGIERIEAGLLSYGNDMTVNDTPFECGLTRYVDLDADSLARDALRARSDPGRRIKGVKFDEGPLPGLVRRWTVCDGEESVGDVTSAAMSPDFGHGIGIAMLEIGRTAVGTRLDVALPGGETRGATVCDLPMKP